MEAAAPLPPPLEEPEHPHLRHNTPPDADQTALTPGEPSGQAAATSSAQPEPTESPLPLDVRHSERSEEPLYSASDPAGLAPATELRHSERSEEPLYSAPSAPEPHAQTTLTPPTHDQTRPIPIATAGDLHMMPPATGLPAPRSRNGAPLDALLDSIPETHTPEPAFAGTQPETAAHGD